MPAIVYSSKDPAGFLIADQLKRNYNFEPRHSEERMWVGENDAQMIELRTGLLEAEDLQVESDYLIFASKHSGKAGKPSLTAHFTGNWGKKPEMGGRPKEVCYPQASALKNALLALVEQKHPAYDVSLEVTHHGPTSLLPPLYFIELGATDLQWRDAAAAKAVGDAIMRAIAMERERQYTQIAFGIGGNHYAPDFTKIELQTDWAFAHILPAYAIDEADEEVMAQALEKSNAELIVIDWKGLNAPQREKAVKFADGAKVKWVKDDELKA